MQKLKHLLLIMSTCLLFIAVAQDTSTEPATDPATDVDTTDATMTQDPMLEALDAMVRVANAGPNSSAISISFMPDEDTDEATNMSGMNPEGMQAVAYNTVTDYITIPEGDYIATVTNDAGETLLEQEVEFNGDTSYTLAALGLVLPNEGAEAPEDDGGFFQWIGDLFSGDDAKDRDALALRLEVFNDDRYATMNDGETRLRVIHAAPGAAPIDVVATIDGEEQMIVDELEFGEDSNYHNILASASNLQVRVSDSDAVVVDLSDVALESGMLQTVFVVGTSLEQVPFEALTVSSAPVAPPTAAVDPLDATAPVTDVAPATDETADVATDEATTDVDMEETAADEMADEAEAADTADMNSIMNAAVNDPELRTFVLVLAASDMASTLEGDGPYTVFAPNNDAFAALSAEQLNALMADPALMSNILSAHVVEGSVMAADVAGMQSAMTLGGQEFTIDASGDSVMIGNASVVAADIEASNGVIHVIDTVLMPEQDAQ